jgi:ADP-ribose pyrophosphatase YjhB (NUDIX family)
MTITADKRPALGVSTLVVRNGSALLVKRAKAAGFGLWSLPGGHVEWGEPLRDAARREVVEETGVTCEITRLLDTIDVIHRDPEGRITVHYAVSVFLGRWIAGAAAAASDASDARWVRAADLASLPMTPGTADLVLRVLERETAAGHNL